MSEPDGKSNLDEGVRDLSFGGHTPTELRIRQGGNVSTGESFGRHRLVWGSDWIYTKKSSVSGFMMEQMRALECSAQVKRSLLVEAPHVLFRFEEKEM